VTVRATIGRLASRLQRPRTTVRWRLTLLYGGLFLACGAALLAVTYTLVAHATVSNVGHPIWLQVRGDPALPTGQPPVPRSLKPQFSVAERPVPPFLKQLLRSRAGKDVVSFVGSEQRISDLHQLEIESVIALAIMAIISGALGWLFAGRVLRPLRTITTTAHQISERNLHERLAMPGPPDELKHLADTIDGLLERLEGAFDAQRRFVANASHELRTPLTVARTLLEMVVSDPHATVDTFRDTCRQVLDETHEQEQLIDALLILARGHRGLEHREPLDLAAITDQVLQEHQPGAAERALHLDVSLEPAILAGDRRLIERLISNLLDNAIRHNTPDGRVDLHVQTWASHATLTIVNTGPRVPTDQIDRLLQPFQRLEPDRIGHIDGLGLGLSIVAAIATAHDAALDIQPAPGGGLHIEVRFPAAHENPQAAPNVTPRAAGVVAG
jgi:signal transduction histidine kinase